MERKQLHHRKTPMTYANKTEENGRQPEKEKFQVMALVRVCLSFQIKHKNQPCEPAKQINFYPKNKITSTTETVWKKNRRYFHFVWRFECERVNSLAQYAANTPQRKKNRKSKEKKAFPNTNRNTETHTLTHDGHKQVKIRIRRNSFVKFSFFLSYFSSRLANNYRVMLLFILFFLLSPPHFNFLLHCFLLLCCTMYMLCVRIWFFFSLPLALSLRPAVHDFDSSFVLFFLVLVYFIHTQYE